MTVLPRQDRGRAASGAVASPKCAASRKDQRRGLVLVALLVGLLIVGLVAASRIQMLVAQAQRLRSQRMRIQAYWLAVSGVRRAAARLRADAAYAGETWRIPSAVLPLGGAEVRLRVESVAGNPTARRIRAVADYPAAHPRRASLEKQITVQLPRTGDSS